MKLAWIFLLGILFAPSAFATDGVTKIGNGDDGADLEGAIPVDKGPIVDAREEAVRRLRRLGTEGVRGLGILIPEVAGSQLYTVPIDKTAGLPEDQGTFHADMQGRVYARTIASPHAATRFFPVAEKLSLDPLVALHIHEGLHRALPSTVRTDEGAVAQVTLALTAPGATHDSVQETVDRYLPASDLRQLPPAGAFTTSEPARATPDSYKTPSNVGYQIRQYLSHDDATRFPINRMHVIHSDLYPFGGATTPFGFGIEASFIEAERANVMGPLGLSARFRVLSRRSFDIGVWATASLNTLSAEELKSSPFGRDVFSTGVTFRKTLNKFYVENLIGFTVGGRSTQTLNRTTYTWDYGDVINVRVRGGVHIKRFDLGGFVEVHLADDFKFNGGAESYEKGRYRILSVGPEVTYTMDDVSLSLNGRFLLDSTKNANFDDLGNLMGVGAAQGSIGASVSVFF